MMQQELILQLIEYRVKKFLLREKQETQGILYSRTGRGANPQEFEAVLRKLAGEGFLTLTPTGRLTNKVSLSEVTNGTPNA